MFVVSLALTLLGTAPPVVTPETSVGFLIVQPHGRGDARSARGFLDDLATALKGAWPETAAAPDLQGRYHVSVADALASVAGDRPAFGLVSTGFLDAHGDELKLEILARPELPPPARAVHHLVGLADSSAGDAVAARNLAGLRLAGRACGELGFLEERVLSGFTGLSEAELLVESRVLSALRRLRRGQADVVILRDADWQRLVRLDKTDGLTLLHESPTTPESPWVSFGEHPLAEDFSRALITMGETEAGRRVLKRMNLVGFVPVTEEPSR
ncbi:MAG: PhnD/SsuA/transferrin family substrate-binding protein [Acidobacteriota bacterium]